MNELQQVQYEMLKRFVFVCENLNLRYFVLGGTLLGAVRHQGFIPWDDDIDVGMPREDYEVFLEKGQGLLVEPYFLQTHITDPGYPMNFAKIRNNNTTFIETSLRNFDINHGVYLDIFPLDFYPNCICKKISFHCKNWIYSGRVASEYYYERKLPLKSKIKQVACKLMQPSLKKTILKREALLKACKQGGQYANHCGAWGNREIMPAEWFGAGTELTFEGLKVIGPKEYDKYLSQLYGDYMQLPPVEKRQGHHYVEALDLKKSYISYRK